jgi:hypothetical protein
VGSRTIAEIAFDLWVEEEDGLIRRLGLATPERHEAGTQCWQYANTALDIQNRVVVHTFTRGVGTRQWSFRPWEGDRPNFEPVLEVTIQTLRIKAKEAWRSASDALDAAVADGRVVIAARIGSPLNDPQSLPASAWAFVEVGDWAACTGNGNGIGELYDLREAQAAAVVAKSKGGRLLKVAEEAVAALYPNGVPSHVTNDQLRGSIDVYLNQHGIDRVVSLDTAKRAAGRR